MPIQPAFCATKSIHVNAGPAVGNATSNKLPKWRNLAARAIFTQLRAITVEVIQTAAHLVKR
jgi:hypothetical protein